MNDLLTKHMKNKFYGMQEVVDTRELDIYTSVLMLKDGSSEKIATKMLSSVLTEKPVDATELRKLRIIPVTENILSDLLSWDIKTSEVEYLMTMVITSLNENMKNAEEKLWGVNSLNKRISDIDKVLKSNAQGNSDSSDK